ncbi:MAG: glycosyltransferase, partial [Phocaeicola sp.]
EQDYPTYEVIVVYDKADEDCSDTLKIIQGKYPHLYYSFIPETARYISRKKLGITTGIKASHYEWIVFTEVDCQPRSNQWLRHLATHFDQETDIVLGYSNYEKRNNWFNKVIIFDTLLNSMRYLGLAISGIPYMGKGRNMAYRKSLFYKSKGFASHLKLQRGEDDLFINQHATKHNTKVALHPDSFVIIDHPFYKQNWRNEKLNYAINSKHFKGFGYYITGFETTSRLLFFAFIIASIAHTIHYQQWILTAILLGITLLRYLIQLFVFVSSAKQLHTRSFYLLIPLFDIIQPLRNWKYKLKNKKREQNQFQRK